ncbi:juvenile hormone acid O-methyltransferase-like [Phlebotomus argentipes]|uniref:juvenile hormone acid O-methyltransferase-like n=1 Tax=Phlebotomus argentipes TaxID=94469 RepID=UPI002892A18E|nr:juvenile hormone acid O-methyltransferase-like [Phlebotomus argentipes]
MEKKEEKYDIREFRETTGYRIGCIKPCFDRLSRKIQWRGGERVLDIGCGPGDITRSCILPLLPQNFEKLVCADISPEMLEICKSEFIENEKVEFLQMDILKTPEKSLKGSFDRIFSTYCFMYISDQKTALKNIFDLLAPGGDCWINQLAVVSGVQPLFQLAESPKWKNKLQGLRNVHVYPFNEDPNPIATGEKYMKSIGFTNISVTIEESFHQMESEKRYEMFLEGLPNPSKNFNEEDRKALMRDQIEIAKSLNLFKEEFKFKPMREPHQFLVFYGRKLQ